MKILERHREGMRAGAGKLIYDLSWPKVMGLAADVWRTEYTPEMTSVVWEGLSYIGT